MKLYLHINVFLIILIFLTGSCKERSGSSARLESLHQLNDHLETTNSTKMKSLQDALIESGGREAQEAMMEELESILPLFSVISQLTLQTKMDDIRGVVDELDSVSHMDTWYRTEEIDSQMHTIKHIFEVYQQTQDPLDLAIMINNLHLLKSLFIEDRQIKIHLPTFEPVQVNFFIQNDTFDLNQSFTAIMTLEQPIDEGALTVLEERMEITWNERSINDYELKTMGGGSWIINFIPKYKGNYTISFEGNLDVLIDKDAIPLSFVGRYELFVN